MARYVSINQFDNGWTFFAKKIETYSYGYNCDGKFPCSDYACSGCDDWLDSDNQNRKV